MTYDHLPLLLALVVFFVSLAAKRVDARILTYANAALAAFFVVLGLAHERLRWPALLFAVLAGGIAYRKWSAQPRSPQR